MKSNTAKAILYGVGKRSESIDNFSLKNIKAIPKLKKIVIMKTPKINRNRC